MFGIDEGIKKEFTQIRATIEEHLSAINENTSEIQALFDYLQEIENKIEKISQRLDQMELNNNLVVNNKPIIVPLNQIERKIFLTLYTEELPLAYCEIAERSGLSPTVVNECISSLGSKGIPLSRTFVNNKIFVKIEHGFKEQQAKENLINLSLDSFM